MLPPYCRVVIPRDSDKVEVSVDKWCFQPWCYVNGTACAGSGVSTKPATYEYDWLRPENAAHLHYSYDTCDSEDLYTADYNQMQDLEAREQMMAYLVPILSACLAAMLLCMAVAVAVLARRRTAREALRRRLRLCENDALATAVACEDGMDFHIFLSHAWQSGQAQAHLIKEHLVAMLPSLKVSFERAWNARSLRADESATH